MTNIWQKIAYQKLNDIPICSLKFSATSQFFLAKRMPIYETYFVICVSLYEYAKEK